MGPDPDGSSGSLQRRAQRLTYNADGAVTLAEQGTVAGLVSRDSEAAGHHPLRSLFNRFPHVLAGARRVISGAISEERQMPNQRRSHRQLRVARNEI